MQMRRAQLSKNSHRQRLATPGIAKTLFRVFLSLSCPENRRALSFRVESRKPVAERQGNFPGCLDFARHHSAVYETSSLRTWIVVQLPLGIGNGLKRRRLGSLHDVFRRMQFRSQACAHALSRSRPVALQSWENFTMKSRIGFPMRQSSSAQGSRGAETSRSVISPQFWRSSPLTFAQRARSREPLTNSAERWLNNIACSSSR